MRKTIDVPDRFNEDLERLAKKNMRSVKNQLEAVLVPALEFALKVDKYGPEAPKEYANGPDWMQ